MNSLLQDVQFGLRMLWKYRLTSLVCIVALSMGMAATTAIFSLAEAFLLHPVPFESADRIVALTDSLATSTGSQSNGGDHGVDVNPIAPATYFEWKEQARSFDQFAAYCWDEINLTGDPAPQKVQDFRVSTNFFETLGVQPMIGRAFLPDQDVPGKDREIILSYKLWETRYGSDPHIVDKEIKVDGKNFRVVAVMPKGFDYPMPAEAWLPITFDTKERLRHDHRWLFVLGRLKNGVSFAEGAAEMQTIAQRQADAYPDTNKGYRLHPRSLPEFATGTLTRQYMLLLMGAVGFVLLIACANVANVQFARVTGRATEFAIRGAMGGSRWRIVRQLLVESVLLSLIGAGCGLLLAQWYLQMILSHMPPDVAKFIAGWKTIRLDGAAFLFTLGIAIASGVVSGIAPALLTSWSNIGGALKEGGRGSSAGRARHRLRGALVVAEVALALVLLVGAGLLVKNFQGLLNVNESYSPQTLLTMNVSLPETQYADVAARRNFHEQMLQKLSIVPGVESAAIVSNVPYAEGGYIDEQDFSIEGRPPAERGEITSAIVETTAPNYFGQFHIGLRDGRLLNDSDDTGTQPATVISASLAKKYFAGQNPLGHRIKLGKANSDRPWMTIVGVVSDVHYSWLVKEDVPTLYQSFRQTPPLYTTIVLRASGDPLKFISAVRAQVGSVDPDLPLYNIKPMDKVITESIIGIAYVAAMMAVLGGIALMLASVGVFGVMSYSVSERTREIGVRLSLGAQTTDIVRLVLRSGMLLTVLGLVIGLPIAFLLARALASLLFGVEATDPFSFVGLPLILAGVAAIACYLPARRAARTDPILALRGE